MRFEWNFYVRIRKLVFSRQYFGEIEIVGEGNLASYTVITE